MHFFFPFLLHRTWDLSSVISDTPEPFALGARWPSILDHQGNLWICFVSAYHGPAYPSDFSLTAHEITRLSIFLSCGRHYMETGW